MERPLVLDLLINKHPAVLQKLDKDSIRFLTRQVQNSKRTLAANKAPIDVEEDGCSITMSRLHPNVTEEEIWTLMERRGFTPLEVSIPRESRRQRSSCVATITLESSDIAVNAVHKLRDTVIFGQPVIVELADRAVSSRAHQRGVSWKAEDELWQVALHDPNESVAEFGRRLRSAEASSQLVPARGGVVDSRNFQAAASREREQERQRVREALSSASKEQ